ncbi:glycosyltransferase [Vreelandella arctica]|uniref:glycosyltransferase n=1 Tax=Vreelandella arctica TaxID=3126499 RepID=UPI00300E5AA4
MKKIHIKIADKGWILEKCASEIVKHDKNITYGLHDEPHASLQYYINYSARKKKICPIEVGFFTHSEVNKNARDRFFSIAKEMDYCVCMSDMYKNELTDAGVNNVSVIPPGVDLTSFKPKVKIGVIGRTYHTGRKGENLVKKVMDIPGIEWRFTGEGWPGDPYNVAEGLMPEFYNDLDYVLVPALYEGGPMSVIEGLACGKPIISSNVGWVSKFPHIEFENGSSESLRFVLQKIVYQRQQLRSSVLDISWENWAYKHIQIFDKLLSKSYSKVSKKAKKIHSVLITHGDEKKSLGGPSVRVPKTVEALLENNVNAEYIQTNKKPISEANIAHVFNIWHPDTCFEKIASYKKNGKKIVFSPIFLNLANHKLFSQDLPGVFQNYKNFESKIIEIDKKIAGEPNLPIREIFPGYHKQVAACTKMADHIICLSEYELKCLQYLDAINDNHSIVRNPVDSDRFNKSSETLFKQQYGLDEYILCVGRIEPRKNQLMVAEAARRLGKKVVFIGHEGNPNYARLVKERAGEYGVFIPRIAPNNPLLGSAFVGASVFTLPSWSEGAPLAALEASSTGVPMVLSDRSSEREYFGNYAKYVRPSDLDGLTHKLEESLLKKKSKEQENFIKKSFTWDKNAAETAAAYEKVINIDTKKYLTEYPNTNEKLIYFDITDYIYAGGKPSGIPRVVEQAYNALSTEFPHRSKFICWKRNTSDFVEIKPKDIEHGGLLERIQASEPASNFIEKGSIVLSFGGAWVAHDLYFKGLINCKQSSQSVLYLLIHDLVRYKLNYLYPVESASKFELNARHLFSHVDAFLTYSQSTKLDLTEFLKEYNFNETEIIEIRLGDYIPKEISAIDSSSSIVDKYSNEEYVMFVSSFDKRKNHALLLKVWERLIETRGESVPKLLLIGKVMWPDDPVVEELTRNEKISKHVHHLVDIKDNELDWLYKNCLFTVFPSVYEGWGLPVVESLLYNKFCITSNASSTAEIAPYLTELLDPYDFKEWLKNIEFYIDNEVTLKARERKIKDEFKPFYWNEAIKFALEKIYSSDSLKFDPPALLPNKNICFNKNDHDKASEKILNNGWRSFESSGIWSFEKVARLNFCYPKETDRLMIELKLFFLSAKSIKHNQEVKILINDSLAFQINTSELGSRELNVKIPISDYVETEGEFYHAEISLVVDKLLKASDVFASTDVRELGVLLKGLCLMDLNSNAPPKSPPLLGDDVPVANFDDLKIKNDIRMIKMYSLVKHSRQLTDIESLKLREDDEFMSGMNAFLNEKAINNGGAL